MKDLEIIRIKNELRTDSRLLSSFLDHRHRTILENIDKYAAELLELSELPFQTELGQERAQGGRSAVRYALLTEDQCYFLLTLMRNNDRVVAAKLALVKSFRDARAALAERDAARIEGKKARKLETDSIKLLVEYASAKGSKSAERYYTNVTKMTNNLLSIQAGQRDTLSAEYLKKLSAVETIVDLAIRDGIRAGMQYKEVYQLARVRAGALVDVMGLVQRDT